MTMIQLIACIGMIAGLFMVLGISPAEMSDSIFSRLTAAPGSIRADINETTKRKKAGFFRREITEAQAVLAASGREGKFPMVCMASLVLFALGACIAILAGNAFLVPVLAVLTWFKESRRADELVKARMELIEGELPRFVATIHQELAASRDVLRILENYKKHAGPDFGRELDVLTADMRSSSYEAALIRFEARMGSAIISDIVRGLIGILRGDDGRMYFQMLSHDLKALELQRLKAKAAKIPPKIRVFSFIMLMCFMMTYIVIIVYQIVNSLGSLF